MSFKGCSNPRLARSCASQRLSGPNSAMLARRPRPTEGTSASSTKEVVDRQQAPPAFGLASCRREKGLHLEAQADCSGPRHHGDGVGNIDSRSSIKPRAVGEVHSTTRWSHGHLSRMLDTDDEVAHGEGLRGEVRVGRAVGSENCRLSDGGRVRCQPRSCEPHQRLRRPADQLLGAPRRAGVLLPSGTRLHGAHLRPCVRGRGDVGHVSRRDELAVVDWDVRSRHVSLLARGAR